LRDGERTLDLVMRVSPEWRDRPEKLAELPIETGLKSADGTAQRVPLRLVADVREATGPNVINRENTQRRIVISANTTERDLQTLSSGYKARWSKR
jgi:Cu/Ag efflux pump CusA